MVGQLPEIELRHANAIDSQWIERILLLAGNWRGDSVPQLELSDINSAYYADWGQPQDLGVLAFSGPDFAGGAYARHVEEADATYGFLSPELKELTMGVEIEHRHRGVGRLALEALQRQVIQAGGSGMSLSVEVDNDVARSLYESTGFFVAELRATDVLMAWRP